MSTCLSNSTSLTLLDRLRQSTIDHAAWARFERVYRPVILARCLARGLQPADAEDVTQVVLVRVVERIDQFERRHTAAFRGYLAQLVRYAILDFNRAKANRHEVQADGDFAGRARGEEEITEREVTRSMLEQLGDVYKGQEKTLQAAICRLVERKTARETGLELGMSEGNVNTAVGRVRARLRATFGDLVGRTDR